MANSLSEAFERVLHMANLDEPNAQKQKLIFENLNQSTGTTPTGQKVYREYYVTALEYWLLPENNLIKGEGAIFDQNKTVTLRYLQLQRQIDEALELEVSKGFEASALINQILQTDDSKSNDVVVEKKYKPSFLSF